MGQFTRGLQTEIAAPSGLPLIIDLHQDRTNQANNGRLFGDYTDHIRAALDLLVKALQGLVE